MGANPSRENVVPEIETTRPLYVDNDMTHRVTCEVIEE